MDFEFICGFRVTTSEFHSIDLESQMLPEKNLTHSKTKLDPKLLPCSHWLQWLCFFQDLLHALQTSIYNSREQDREGNWGTKQLQILAGRTTVPCMLCVQGKSMCMFAVMMNLGQKSPVGFPDELLPGVSWLPYQHWKTVARLLKLCWVIQTCPTLRVL